VRRADNLATCMCQLSRNPGSVKLLELKGPVQACTGIALPLKYEAEVLISQPQCSVNCSVYDFQLHYISSLTKNMW
jgi:hypothetical protein